MSLIVIAYLYDNLQISGFVTGEPRWMPGHQSVSGFLAHFFQGVFNELCFARNHPFNGRFPDWLFTTMLFLQILTVAFVLNKKKRFKLKSSLNNDSRILFTLSGFYLCIIFLVNWFVPFDTFDFRILFPFSALFFVGFFAWLISEPQNELFNKTYKLIVLFGLLSCLVNLPKKHIWHNLTQKTHTSIIY